MKKVRYDTLVVVCIVYLTAVLAFFNYSSFWLLVGIGVWIVSHGPGLAVGYHRLLTHNSFKTPKLVEYILTIAGTLTLQGGHIKWVAIHRKHHQHTDEPGDPHTPREGFFHSHMGWIINCDMTLDKKELLIKYAPDLHKDPFHRFLNRFWWLPSTVLGLSLLYVGGLPAMLWVIFVPVAAGLQFTWLVNSVCHRLGSQPNKTGDDSRNNWWVALLTFGEGWHNNHHDKPIRARHGLKWYQVDFSWYFIQLLRISRLVTDVKL